MKRIFTSIAGNLLIGLFALGLMMTVIGLGYRGRSHHVSTVCLYIALPGMVVLAPFLVWFIKFNRKLKKHNRILRNSLKNLQSTGVADEIDLSLVKIVASKSLQVDSSTPSIN